MSNLNWTGLAQTGEAEGTAARGAGISWTGFSRRAFAAGLRASTAVLIAGCADLAQAQSAPAPAEASVDDQQSTARRNEERAEHEGRDARGDHRPERVYVRGQRIDQMATMPNPEEAPQVVNVITSETLSQQAVATLEQALRNVAGITTQIGEGGVMNGDQFFIRGLSAKNDIFTDGLRDFGVFTRDSFNYESLEVLKGPSGGAVGRGSSGGAINSATKTPTLMQTGSFTVAGGNADYARATADINQPLADGIALRLNLMAHQNGVEGRDMIESERWGVAPSIGFGIDGPTKFTLSYLHQTDERVPDYGLPVATLNGRGVLITDYGVPSSNFYGYEADTDETTVDTVTARLSHAVDNDILLTTDTKAGVYTRFFQQTAASCPAPSATAPVTCSTQLTDNNPATVPLATMGSSPYDQTTFGVQNVSTAHINKDLFGHANEFMIGWDVSYQDNDRDQFNYAVTRAPKNLFTPAHTPNPTFAPVRNNVRVTTAKEVSLFFNDRFWFDPQWSVTLGARQSWFEVDQNTTAFTVGANGSVTSVYTPLSSNTDFLTPAASVIWEPTKASQIYVSYASSATPPGTTVSNGSVVAGAAAGGSVGTSDLDPEETDSYEVGGRLSLFEDKLQLQGSVFHIEKSNAKEVDPLSNLIVRSGDAQEVDGFELSAGGRILEQWGVNANYAFTDATTSDSATAANIGKRVPFSPKLAASVWSTWDFNGPLLGLQAGLGVTWQDSLYLDAANLNEIDGYTTLDALVSYGWDRFRLSVNAYNLTDELYFSQVHGSRVVPGQGRSFVVTLGMVY